MVAHQGDLDGLCGPYAVANAFWHLGLDDKKEAFKIACLGLNSKRWPSYIWDGTTFGDVKKMVKNCIEAFDPDSSVKMSTPFERAPPASNDEYWSSIDNQFQENENLQCGIIRLTKPDSHWVVIFRDGKRVTFLNSDGDLPFYRKNRSSLYAGLRSKKPGVTKVDRRELILLTIK